MRGYAFEKIRPITEGNQLKAKLELVHHLMELECASKILLGAQARLKGRLQFNCPPGSKILPVFYPYILKPRASGCLEYSIGKIGSEHTGISVSFLMVKDVQHVNVGITCISFFSIARKWHNFYESLSSQVCKCSDFGLNLLNLFLYIAC